LEQSAATAAPHTAAQVQGKHVAEPKAYWVYILVNQRNGTLYIGVTNDLLRRVSQHRKGIVRGFTNNYGVKHLVYFEEFTDIRAAINRETRLKKWNRKWKLDLIESQNPEWKDLYEELIAPWPLPGWLTIANEKSAESH
jgi:putative endonuclease